MLRKTLAFTIISLCISAGIAFAVPPQDFRSLYKNAGPAVVNINTERIVELRRSPFFSPFDDFFFNGPGMGNPFAPFENPRGEAPKSRQRSLGSGFIVSEDGYIVTNHHVVDGADKIKVTISSSDGAESSYDAEIVGGDKDTDLAVLKINAPAKLPFLKFGDSSAMEVGDWVLAIGNPFGLDHTATAGIISAKDRNIRSGPFDSFFQTDASINPGNSGGPLLNMKGEVVGINTAIVAGGQGIGFAIPSNKAEEIVSALRDGRRISRGWLGVYIQNVDEGMAKALGLGEAKGAFIADVVPDNPAAKAGVKAGDVIIAVNDATVSNSDDLLRRIASLKPGDSVSLGIWRDGKEQKLSATLSERGSDQAEAGKDGTPQEGSVAAGIGLSVRALTSQDISRFHLESASGLLVTAVDSSKAAAEAGLRVGDVILAVNGNHVESVAAFTKLLETQGRERGAVMLQISRQGQKFFRTIELPEQEKK